MRRGLVEQAPCRAKSLSIHGSGRRDCTCASAAAYGLVRGASRTSAAQVRSLPRTRSVRTSSAALDSESQFVGVTGEKLDEAAAKELPAGSFVMPAKQPHFAITKGETIVQLHGMGPWAITYLNPTDDPRSKAAAK